MLGIEKAYLGLALKTLVRANKALGDMLAGFAVENVAGGKADTMGLDTMTEQIIIAEAQDFDSSLVVITEEKGKIPEDLLLDRDKVVFFCDPTDRSKPLERFILEQLGLLSEGVHGESVEGQRTIAEKRVRELLDPARWCVSYGSPLVSGAYGSITAVREGRILFNAMVNYITQQMFVACPQGVFYFDVSSGTIPADLKGTEFAFPKKSSQKFAAFLGKDKYVKNIEQTGLGIRSENCVVTDPGGPARILYLSSLYGEQPIGFIMANGEKIGEWLGWLAYAMYANDADDRSRRALRLDQISFEDAGTREKVPMAVAPHLSILEERDGRLYVNLDKLRYYTGKPSPNHYRETLLVTHPGNVETIVHRLNATATCRQLKL